VFNTQLIKVDNFFNNLCSATFFLTTQKYGLQFNIFDHENKNKL